MKMVHGPTFPAGGIVAEGVIDAVPSWAVTTCAWDDPKMIGAPSAPMRASVVAKVTLTPITGFAEVDPSVMRSKSGWKF